MKRVFKKLIWFMMVLALFMTALPASVAAYYGEDGMGEAEIDLDKVFLYNAENELLTNVTDDDLVYFSISNDGEFMQSDVTGDTMAYIPVKISDVASVNLEDYGLGDYKWESYDLAEQGETEQYYVTLMQLFVYVTEKYYPDGWNVEVTGSSGSTYLKNGFWGHDENLTYYVSGEYPLQREGWGATSDHIALEAGDYVDVQMYTDWNFWCTDGAGYRYFVDNTSGEILHNITTDLCNPTTIRLGRAWGNVDVGENTSIVNEEEGYEVYATKEKDPTSEALWSGTIDENADFKITGLAPGSYYLWVHGNSISAPAYARLQVTCSHTNTEVRDAQEASCAAAGYTGDTYCKDCGLKISEGSEVMTADHTGGTEIRDAKEATCAEDGYTGDTYCKGCNTKIEVGSRIPATGIHTPGKADITPATIKTVGKIEYKCSVCGKITERKTIASPKVFTLSAKTYTYDGKVKKPSLKVYDSAGNVIGASNYTITYPQGRKNAGKYTYKITFKSNYSGTGAVSFTILPKKAVVKKVTAAKKSLTVYAGSKAASLSATGYQIAYRAVGTSGWKYKTTTAIKTKISGLKKSQKYQIKIRAYKKAGSTSYYGAWSSAKTSKAVK